MKLRSIDLNLLVVLDALIAERSVQQAGRRVGLSQSATSHALDRLRKFLGDQLLVRTASEWSQRRGRSAWLARSERHCRTSKERSHQTPSIPLQLKAHLQSGSKPTGRSLSFHNSWKFAKRHQALRLRYVRDRLMRFWSVSIVALSTWLLARGHFPDRFMTCHLLSDEHVCVMRAGHPEAHVSLSLEKYLAADHLLLSMSSSRSDEVDEALASRNLTRRIVMPGTHALAAVIALLRSDMLASVNRRAAHIFNEIVPLVRVELPFRFPLRSFGWFGIDDLITARGILGYGGKFVAIAGTTTLLPTPKRRNIEVHGGKNTRI